MMVFEAKQTKWANYGRVNSQVTQNKKERERSLIYCQSVCESLKLVILLNIKPSREELFLSFDRLLRVIHFIFEKLNKVRKL